MYFPDLSAYEYFKGRPHALNVGWLDRAHAFTQGDVPNGFVQRLRAIARRPVNQTRGFYVCPFCDFGSTAGADTAERYRRWREAEALSSAEIRVVGRDGTAYAAPILICHYVEKHGYRPPPEFVQAVMEQRARPGAISRYLELCVRPSSWSRWWPFSSSRGPSASSASSSPSAALT